jgi:hypothetical protein
MISTGAERPSVGRQDSIGDVAGRHRTGGRAVSRVVTLALAVGFAVVGVAGSASAWDNTISGTVACASGGGWTVTWRVVNSEREAERITASNRQAAVAVGTTLEASETRTFTETITSDTTTATATVRRAPSAKPTSDVTLTLSAEWDTGDTSTDSGTIPVSSFSDDCVVTTVPPPPVVTPPPPVVTPPVVAPPVVVPPEVLPAEVRVVTAKARHIDKCGRSGDMYKVSRRPGVVYRAGGKVLREGRWLKATHRRIIVRATAADATFRLTGKSVWRMSFSNRPCAQAPEAAPDTGA